MKRLLSAFFAFLILFSSAFCLAAPSTADWTTITPGYLVDGKYYLQTAVPVKNGIQLRQEMGYYKGDGNYAGIIYNKKINPSNLKVEFVIDQIADEMNNTDTWVTVSVLNKKTFFNTQDATNFGAGLVTLIHPYQKGGLGEVYVHTPQKPFKCQGNFKKIMAGNTVGQPVVVEFQEYSKGKYTVQINHVTINVGLLDLGSEFFQNGAYLVIGLSNNNKKPQQITITKINNMAVADNTPPHITGISNGGYYQSVVLQYDEGTATLNGKAVEVGTTVNKQGKYDLLVTDGAGNNNAISFTIDRTAPIINVKGKAIIVTDNYKIKQTSATLPNGKAIKWPAKNQFPKGTYMIKASDMAGNATSKTVIIK